MGDFRAHVVDLTRAGTGCGYKGSHSHRDHQADTHIYTIPLVQVGTFAEFIVPQKRVFELGVALGCVFCVSTKCEVEFRRR